MSGFLAEASITRYGAVGDGRERQDATIGAGSRLVTSASAGFTSSDLGKLIDVHGAGAGGVVHATTITAVIDAATVELADAAIDGVSSATIVWGSDNRGAIASALASANGAIVIPPGRFLISSAGGQQRLHPLVGPTPFMFDLEDRDDFSVLGFGTLQLMGRDNWHLFRVRGCNRLRIEGLTIIGNREPAAELIDFNAEAGDVIFMEGGNAGEANRDIAINDCHFARYSITGIRVGCHCERVRIANCTGHDGNDCLVQIGSAACAILDDRPSKVEVRSCIADRFFTDAGFKVRYAAADVSIIGCESYAYTGTAAQNPEAFHIRTGTGAITGVDRVRLIGCRGIASGWALRMHEDVTTATQPRDVLIESCDFDGQVVLAGEVRLSGSRISRGVSLLQGFGRIVMDSNDIDGADQHGVFVDQGDFEVILRDNVVRFADGNHGILARCRRQNFQDNDIRYLGQSQMDKAGIASEQATRLRIHGDRIEGSPDSGVRIASTPADAWIEIEGTWIEGVPGYGIRLLASTEGNAVLRNNAGIAVGSGALQVLSSLTVTEISNSW